MILPFAVGIATAHFTGPIVPLTDWLVLTGLALVAGGVTSQIAPRLWSIAILGGLFGAGAVHYSVQRQHLPEWDLLPQREVEVQVRIARLFGSEPHDRFQNFLGEVVGARAPVGDLLGQPIHVRIRRPVDAPEAVQRGATLRIVGQLEPLRPSTLATDPFLGYLFDSGHNFRIRQARWLQTSQPPSLFARTRHRLKVCAGNTLSAGLRHHPEIVGALRAMLLGERHLLTAEAETLFLRSGTMHLFAISGLHIGIIAVAINSALRLVRIPRVTAFAIGSLILLGYVDLIGLSPSAVRAWIMITCFHGARVLRAPSNPVAAISASALIVMLIDPTQLFSAGFQMSYAIVFMLLLYGVPLADYWRTRARPWRDMPRASLGPNQRWIQDRCELLVGAIAITWSASLIGVITGVGIFGWFTPFAFVANLVLVPIAGFVISAGFGSVVLGLFGINSLALLLNHAAGMGLWVMYGGLEYPLKFTAGIQAEFRSSWWGEWGVVAVLVTTVLAYESGGIKSRWRWWGPVGITLLLLVTGLRFP